MGKAIDALYNASVQIEQDGKLYLEKFMNGIFNEIYTDQDGNDAPLPPLEEAMQYQYEVKQTPALDGSKVLPFDQLNAELFYLTRKENIDTNEIVKVMACEVAECLLEELSDPKKQLLIISQSLVANSVGVKQLKKNTMLALGS